MHASSVRATGGLPCGLLYWTHRDGRRAQGVRPCVFGVALYLGVITDTPRVSRMDVNRYHMTCLGVKVKDLKSESTLCNSKSIKGRSLVIVREVRNARSTGRREAARVGRRGISLGYMTFLALAKHPLAAVSLHGGNFILKLLIRSRSCKY